MKQLGNLAMVCARRPEVMLQIYGGQAAVHVGAGSDRATLATAWDNDAEINNIIRELNFGKYAASGNGGSGAVLAKKPEHLLTADRAVELINRMIDRMVNDEGGHTRPVIESLLDMGFTEDELMLEFHFSSNDVNECADGSNAPKENWLR